ncbi:MAG: Primosomal protein N [Parcubacteria group bacterium Gr01-1014_13]|nr:MAG: Primosomal protein N [Parcubacteria group bacterium Gr01-1014_13]
MIAQVIPARRMPLSLPFLDYSVPEEDKTKIKIGQLVKIPFRNKEEFGVILNIKSSGALNIKTKPIKEIIFSEPILSKEQLNFLIDISEFYHVSLGFLLKGNLLPLQIRKLQKVFSSERLGAPHTNKPAKPQVFIHKNEEEKKDFILDKIKTGGQSLILVPELTAIAKITNLLPSNILDRSVTITSELKTKELFAKWLQIWSGEKDIIIGTRTALFLPWFNLKNIILTDEGNPNYKSWDMAPRFHTRDAALFLSKHHRAELSILSHTLSVESYYFAKNKVYNTTDDLQIKSLNKTTEIVDMKSQWRGGNRSMMSTDVLEEFKKIKTGDVVFFLNRRGTASYVGCADCGNVLRCPHCKLSLTYHQDKKILVCHYCKFSEPMPLACKNCGSVNIGTRGAGTQMAEELIKKITEKITDTRPVIRLDSDENELGKLENKEDKVIVCTQLAWGHLPWDRIKLFVYLDADSPLFIPEYKIVENLWQQLRDVQYRLNPESSFLVQTEHPEHQVFKSLYSPDLFYSEQLAERRVLGYPPFKYMLKLLTSNPKSAILDKETAQVQAGLINLTKGVSGVRILGPLEMSPYYSGGQYRQVILAKIGYENYKQNTKLLVANVPENWKIDPNPNSLLSE